MKKTALLLALLYSVFIVVSCSPFWGGSEQPVPKEEVQSQKRFLDENNESIFPLVLQEKKSPVNVLLIGSDQRKNEPARADVLMVAQYTPQSTSIKIVSIMRDTFVNIPGFEKSKINHAYTWGGEELLAETIKNNFNIDIHHSVKVNFNDFINMMDLVFPEGVGVTVSEPMIKYWKWAKDPGKQVLKGEEILQYVRFRGDIKSDFGRVERQQEIMALAEKSLMEQMQSGEGITTVVSLMREGLKNVETSTPISEVIKYGMSLMLKPVNRVDTLRVPVEGSFTDLSTVNAGLVLDMDEQKNQEAIRDFLNTVE
ncbi:LCP family protein [Rossellomorea sp. GCM10028870]|uniref:LCP family protein n=1 Tax=Rossellomorea sp. GCM10028870 TaxID=3273426 RepID=UPI003606627D